MTAAASRRITWERRSWRSARIVREWDIVVPWRRGGARGPVDGESIRIRLPTPRAASTVRGRCRRDDRSSRLAWAVGASHWSLLGHPEVEPLPEPRRRCKARAVLPREFLQAGTQHIGAELPRIAHRAAAVRRP